MRICSSQPELRTLGCLWLGWWPRHTATGEVTVSRESLTLVVVGSEDLGLLRVLLLCQVSYLRKTERLAVTIGTMVEFSLSGEGSCKKGRLAGAEHMHRPGLNMCIATYTPVCT